MKLHPDVNQDDTLLLEYTPSMTMEEGQEMPHDDWVSAVAAPFLNTEVVESESIVVTGCYDRRIRLVHNGEVLAVGDGHSSAVKSVAANASATVKKTPKRKRHVPGFTAISGSKDGTVRFWKYSDATSLQSVRTLKYHTDSVDCVAINKVGDLAVSGSWDKSLKLLRVADALDSSIDGEQLQSATMNGHSRPVLAVKFTNDGANIVSSGLDGQVRVWDVSTAAYKSGCSGEYAVYSLDTHPSDPNMILTGHSDKRTRLWDLRSQYPTKTFAGHTGWVYSIAWCPDSTLSKSDCFVTGSEDGNINLHDLRSTRPLTTHENHTDGVLDLAFTAPRVVASGSKDTTVKTTTLKGV